MTITARTLEQHALLSFELIAEVIANSKQHLVRIVDRSVKDTAIHQRQTQTRADHSPAFTRQPIQTISHTIGK